MPKHIFLRWNSLIVWKEYCSFLKLKDPYSSQGCDRWCLAFGKTCKFAWNNYTTTIYSGGAWWGWKGFWCSYLKNNPPQTVPNFKTAFLESSPKWPIGLKSPSSTDSDWRLQYHTIEQVSNPWESDRHWLHWFGAISSREKRGQALIRRQGKAKEIAREKNMNCWNTLAPFWGWVISDVSDCPLPSHHRLFERRNPFYRTHMAPKALSHCGSFSPRRNERVAATGIFH